MSDEESNPAPAQVLDVSPENSARFEAFIAEVQPLLEKHFPEGAMFVIGAQWEALVRDENSPECVVSSNLPLCSVGGALDSMSAECDRIHRASHGLPPAESENVVMEDVSADNPLIPQAMRDMVEKMLASGEISSMDEIHFGIVETTEDPDTINFHDFGGDDAADS